MIIQTGKIHGNIKMAAHKYITTVLFLFMVATAFSQSQMYEIANCNGENRTVLYGEQLSSVMWCLKGNVKFKESIKIKYSKNSIVNTDSLEQKAIQFRKLLPKDYWSEGIGVTRLDTKPNESRQIWFERVYAKEETKGNLKVFAACKVIFDGVDPEIERINPKVKDIIVILDQKELNKYKAIIKKLMLANNIKMPPPQTKKHTLDKYEKPPEVEKLEN